MSTHPYRESAMKTEVRTHRMHARNHLCSGLTITVAQLLALATIGLTAVACGGSTEGVQCGPGTIDVEGSCVPETVDTSLDVADVLDTAEAASDTTNGTDAGIDSAEVSDGAADVAAEASLPDVLPDVSMDADAASTWTADPCTPPYTANCANDCSGPDSTTCPYWMSCSPPSGTVGFKTGTFRMPAAADIKACSTSCAWTAGAIGLQMRVTSPSFGKKIRVKIEPPWQLAPWAPTTCMTPLNKPNCLLLDYTGTGTTQTVFIFTTDKTAPARNFTFEELSTPVTCG